MILIDHKRLRVCSKNDIFRSWVLWKWKEMVYGLRFLPLAFQKIYTHRIRCMHVYLECSGQIDVELVLGTCRKQIWRRYPGKSQPVGTKRGCRAGVRQGLDESILKGGWVPLSLKVSSPRNVIETASRYTES